MSKTDFERLKDACYMDNMGDAADALKAALAAGANPNAIDDGEFGSGRLILYPI